MNKLAKQLQLKTVLKLTLIAFLSLSSFFAQAQESFDRGKKYTIANIAVKGNTTFNEQTIVTFSGLSKGDDVNIPGQEISTAIKKLWNTQLFSDIEVYLSKIEDGQAHLEIRLDDLPEINDIKVVGVKESKVETLLKDTKLKKGVKITENLITTTKNYIQNKNKKAGFLNTKVNVNTIAIVDSIAKPRVNVVLTVDRGQKVKIDSITFEGNSVLSDKKLRSALKNTKQKNALRFYKRSKYIQEEFKEDLVSLVNKYKEIGYRDARVISDTLVVNGQESVNLNIKIEEGKKYKFGDINFIGNTVYSDQFLSRKLRIDKGDTYNGVLLEKRLADATKPDADDITNLYQDNGYLFSTINPVEVSAEDNVIDMEIRITEGKPVHFNRVTVTGNDKTNDHVIYREIRTRPGQLYSKSDVVRTVRELSQLGFFDTEQIVPNFNNANPDEGTIDMEYALVEAGSSQIELQGGYGGGGFIGTLGLSFNNFAIKDLFKKDAYKPVPMGDGQQLALRLQASRLFQTYSFQFSEPWMGGKKPVQFSTSISHTKQFLYDPATRKADKDKRFNITGLTLGLAKRLSVPDDFFTLSQNLSFQHYDLKNYNTGLFTFGDGYSNNLSYTAGLSRNNTFNDPIFPTGGSSFNVSAKLSLPYSSFNDVDYAALRSERETNTAIVNDVSASPSQKTAAGTRISQIDQERFKWLEFYKVKFKGDWYTNFVGKFVFKSSVEFGFLGAYNQDRGVIPFERFYLGGDGLGGFSLDGREAVALRGYPNQALSSVDGGSVYNKFSLELRYPISLKPAAKIYALSFIEGGASYDNFKDYNPFNLKRSAGVGVRIFMPAFGLLGFDFGHGFDPVPGSTIKNGWEPHFIIGQQF